MGKPSCAGGSLRPFAPVRVSIHLGLADPDTETDKKTPSSKIHLSHLQTDPHMRFPPERPQNAAYPGVRVRKKGWLKLLALRLGFGKWMWYQSKCHNWIYLILDTTSDSKWWSWREVSCENRTVDCWLFTYTCHTPEAKFGFILSQLSVGCQTHDRDVHQVLIPICHQEENWTLSGFLMPGIRWCTWGLPQNHFHTSALAPFSRKLFFHVHSLV